MSRHQWTPRGSQETKKQLAELLGRYLASEGCNQAELARRLGLNRAHLGNILHEKILPQPDLIHRIAQLTGTDVEDILSPREMIWHNNLCAVLLHLEERDAGSTAYLLLKMTIQDMERKS